MPFTIVAKIPSFVSHSQLLLVLTIPYAKTVLALVLFSMLVHRALGQDTMAVKTTRRLNIAISNKAPTPDLALMSFHSQAWLAQLFHRKQFRFIIANTFEEAVTRITRLMEREKAMVGNLWFDSHGHMGRRISLMEIGDKEVNISTISEPEIIAGLEKIGRYCDSLSHVSLGSCYSAASYRSAGTDSFPSRPMNGDQLVQAFGKFMNGATMYGSVSWIMTGLGIFGSAYTLAGHPGAKRFRDIRFQPAWDSLGVWRRYTPARGMEYINTVALSASGRILIKQKTYLELEKAQRHQARMLKKLKPGMFSDHYFNKYKEALHHRR